MAEALLITRQDVVKFTAMNGNVDTDNFIQYVKIAQDIHIQNYLGTDLLQKIQTDIINSSLSGDYLALVTNYIKPMLIHFAMVEYLSAPLGPQPALTTSEPILIISSLRYILLAAAILRQNSLLLEVVSPA